MIANRGFVSAALAGSTESSSLFKDQLSIGRDSPPVSALRIEVDRLIR
jgi:hypothetical protein